MLAFLIAMFIFIVPGARRFHRARIYKSLDKVGFDNIINDLLLVIGTDGANTFLSDQDTKKIASVVAVTMNDFLIRFELALASVLLNYDRVANEARDYIRETKEQTRTLVEAFQKDLGLFNADVRLLTADLGTMKTSLENFDQQVQDLTDVNKCLAHSSDELAESAKALVSSANLNVTVCGNINNQLRDLNVTQQAIVITQHEVADRIKQSQEDVAQKLDTTQEKVYQEIVKTQKEVIQQVMIAQQVTVQTIIESQKDVVNEMKGVADVVERSSKDTRDVSSNLEGVANKLEQLTRTDFQNMTDSVAESNQKLIAEVQKTISQITKANQAVEKVAIQLAQVNQSAQTLPNAANQSSQTAKRNLGGGGYSDKDSLIPAFALEEDTDHIKRSACYHGRVSKINEIENIWRSA